MIFLSGLKNLNQTLTFFPIFTIDQNISEKNQMASTQNIYGFILSWIFKNLRNIPSIIFNQMIFNLKTLLK